jgi:rhodanese-related sulfurtransferase
MSIKSFLTFSNHYSKNRLRKSRKNVKLNVEVLTMKIFKKLFLMFLISLSSLCLSACGGDKPISYEQITAEEAKKIMDSEKEFIIIDARTQEEFDEGHIENAIMISEYEIAEKAETKLPNKDALILVYCRSGRRSKIASEELVKLGYTNIKEFGGIIDWPYEIVK